MKKWKYEQIDDNLKENYFDLIVLFQVLEHIPNPVEFLNLCKKYLKTNGKIYIEVPNIDDVLITAYKIPEFKKFYYRQPHVYYYSTDTLSQLMKLIGFDGKVSTDQEYTIFNHINWMITKNPQLSKDLGYFIPKSIENIDNEKYSNIQEFFKKMDNEQKQLLKKENIAENICYIGKITNLT